MEKDLAAARQEAEQAAAKLDNAAFTAKAPAAIVEKTRQRLDAAQADITRLEQRLATI
jgi:valyl-tRNA synthetase